MPRWVAVYLACVVLGGACILTGDQGRSDAVLKVICKCQAAPLPRAQEICLEDLRDDFGNQQIPEACANCILQNQDRCATLMMDCQFQCGGPVEGDPTPVPN
jgi:hypothetical protein